MLTNEAPESVECVVVGAGVVGLAVARHLARAGHEVVVLEAAPAIGTGISSRSSEVIHAGMYYPAGSLKAKLCVEGSRTLRAHAERCGVPVALPGKLIVATTPEEEEALDALYRRGRANGCERLEKLSGAAARAMEPALSCRAAVWSPLTGIIDSHALMLSLQGEAEEAGAALALASPLTGGVPADGGGMVLSVGGAEPMRLYARRVVLCAGLAAPRLGAALGLAGAPQGYLCRGNYFALSGHTPFHRLVYPLPVGAGLGVHFTLDLGGQGRFGPDVEWVDEESYTVDPGRADAFYGAIRRYWPGLPDGALVPAYAGIRPKITPPGAAAADFVIHGPAETGVDGVAALYGIESPGLTACLAIAGHVAERLA